MAFELFDPRRGVRISAGHLPHWFQPEVTYFVTFRTEDSIPTEVADDWRRRRAEWLRRHGLTCAEGVAALPEDLRRRFHQTFSREYMAYLDRGHGACLLRRPDLARIVADSLLHFDGQRYHMGDFVVMPNHVHALVCLIGCTEIEAQCYSWKKFTATKINRASGCRGRFWQEESFDHLVRSQQSYEYFQWYIAQNPRKAGLREGEYFHHRPPPEQIP